MLSAGRRLATAVGLAGLALGVACATPVPGPGPAPAPSTLDPSAVRALVVRAATVQVGAPYRYGGSSPSGFDCSGLVVYTFARAGLHGLPHSASRLEAMSRDVSLDEVKPGDLLFFDLGAKKAQHVGIYVGDRRFVHAPSSGKSVERVSFDHVYWRRQLRRAGRMLD